MCAAQAMHAQLAPLDIATLLIKLSVINSAVKPMNLWMVTHVPLVQLIVLPVTQMVCCAQVAHLQIKLIQMDAA